MIANRVELVFASILFSLISVLHAQSDDSNRQPPVAPVDLQIITRADQILDAREKWNRADTRVCPDDASTFSLYCAIEKASQEISKFEHRSAVMQETQFVIETIAPNRNYEHRLMNYNNEPSTSFADIKRVIRLTEERLQAKLKKDGSPKK